MRNERHDKKYIFYIQTDFINTRKFAQLYMALFLPSRKFSDNHTSEFFALIYISFQVYLTFI